MLGYEKKIVSSTESEIEAREMLCFDSHNYSVEATSSHPEREVKESM